VIGLIFQIDGRFRRRYVHLEQLQTSMASVLVTGGAGFIGTRLCSKLHADGYHVISLDLNHKNEQQWECLTADIRDDLAFESIDFIVHLAAQVSVSQSIIDPAETLSINVDGTSSIIEAAEESGVKRILFASSAAVYGDSDEVPTTENSPLIPQSPYAVSKIVGEELLRRTNIETCAMRFFNVYAGDKTSGSKYAAVIPAFKSAITNQNPCTVFGDGTQVRDFIHVDDLVGIITQLIDSKSIPSELNIATGQGTTLLELIDIISTATGIPAEIEFQNEREGDIHTSIADISKLKTVLANLEFIKLEEGLK